MKSILILSSLLCTATSYAAESTLEIKLEGEYYVNNREIKIKIPKLNKELNQKGLAGLPETVIVGKNPEAYWKLIQKRVEAGNEALERNMHFNIVDEGYIYKLDMCYRGKISDVPKLIESMRGNFLDIDQGILGIAYGKSKAIYDEAFKSRDGLRERFDSEYESNLTNINAWLNYDKKSSTVLVMSDYGPQGDGTELETTLIPPCK